MKLKKGDTVKITVGKDKGRQAKVQKSYRTSGKILVEGLNLYKKHVKKNEQMPQGGVVEIPRALDVSKVMFICPKCKKEARLGFKIEGKKKNRICRKCKSIV